MTRRNTGIFRSAATMLLALIFLLSVLPAAADTAPVQNTKTGTAKTLSFSDFSYNNTDAFRTYINNSLYFKTVSVARASASSLLGSRLNKDEKTLYDALMNKIKDVAAGKASSTHFTLSFSPKFSLASVRNNTSAMAEYADQKMQPMIVNVMYALMGDGPCEMYWFDKEKGIRWDYTGIDKTSSEFWVTGFWMDFFVAKEYSAANTLWSTKVDTSKGKAVQSAAANAKSIMRQNRGKTDTEKLRAYKNAICKLNDYNHAAASDNNTPYGNPWQLVWVFDGDPNTNVVCEGYAKAFQYLCDLSAFSRNISVLCMSGDLFSGNTLLGRHMWNVVTMPDGCRYLVDVTNCDTGASGAAGSDTLFLAGYDSVKKTSYGKKYMYGNIGYVFDREVPKLFTSQDQKLNNSDYDPASDRIKASGTCGKDAEWSLRNGVLKIGGTGMITNYNSSRPAPWKKYTDSIRKIIIGDSITRIGNYAFKGLKNAKAVTIGKKTTTIGQYAFNGCKALSSFTFKGTKLTTVGKNVFKGIPKKATFVCPSGKLSAYKKLLLKKGAPKTATFKK